MYLYLPLSGWPEVVDAHPEEAAISDKIGAIPVRTATPGGTFGFFLRDDCGSRGMGVNPAASLMATVAAGAPAPILGPVVVTSLRTFEVEGAPPGWMAGGVVCMDSDTATKLHTLAENVQYALLDLDDRISSNVEDPHGWARSVRYMIENIQRIKVPEGYPSLPRMLRAAKKDPVADAFAKLGIDVVPQDDTTV